MLIKAKNKIQILFSERRISDLTSYLDYFKGICADKILVDRLLKKIKNCPFDKFSDNSLENFITEYGSSRIMFRKPDLVHYFYNELNDYFISNLDKTKTQALFNIVQHYEHEDYFNRKENINNPNDFNVVELGVFLKKIYEDNYKFAIIDKERKDLNIAVEKNIVSLTSKNRL